MSSRPFPSKYENVCSRCHGKILVGMTVYYPEPNSNDVAHETCPAAPTQPSIAGAAIGAVRSDRFVQIGAWVPVENVEIVIRAIKEARGW